MPKRTDGFDESPGKHRTIDERLFRAWKANDTEACREIWEIFNARVFTVAVRFCRRFADATTARQVATSGFTKAWAELEGVDLEAESSDEPLATRKRGKKEAPKKRAKKRAIVWQGGPQLEKYVRNRVLLRCRDELRTGRSWLGHFVDVESDGTEEDEGTNALENLTSVPATQQDDLFRRGHNRAGVRRIVQELAALGELCRNRPTLLEVVAEMREYLRRCLLEACQQERQTTRDGRDCDSLSLDELADVVDPELVDATQKEMYTHIRTQLGLDGKKNRNTFDQRMKDIRDMLSAPLSPDDDVEGPGSA